MGDLSYIMPVVHPNAGGASGKMHGSDFKIEDATAACVASAKLQLAMLYLLLKDGGEKAKEIISDYKPLFASKEEFLSFLDGLNSSGDRIDYIDENSVQVNIK